MKPFPKISMAFRGALCAFFCLMLGFSGLAASTSAQDPPVATGEANRGRAIFNGIGGCFNCHGNDGVITRLPRHAPQLAEELARLTPAPADLRNPSRLKSRTDADRLRSIKFGHPGTAMFPKKFLSEREVADLLAYLATLREEAAAATRPPTSGQSKIAQQPTRRTTILYTQPRRSNMQLPLTNLPHNFYTAIIVSF